MPKYGQEALEEKIEPQFHQTILYNRLKEYLISKKRDYSLSESGYCHGLTLLWLYKMSEGKEEWFYSLYDKVANFKTKNFSSIEIDIEKLLAHIEWLQNPHNYVKDIQQLAIDKLLERSCDFTLSYLFDHTTLEDTLENLLPRTEMVCLSGPNHTIGVFRRDNVYHIYNPNYLSVRPNTLINIKNIKKEIIDQLFKNCHLSSDKLPLHINIIHHQKSLNKSLSKNIMNKLIENSANINDQSEEKITSLFLACQSGNQELVTKLLDKGANINIACQEGRTALSIAASENHLNLVELLLQRGAEIDKPDIDQSTPLHYAAHHGFEKVVAQLLENGANPLKSNLMNITPLGAAISGMQWDAIVILLSYITPFKNINRDEIKDLREFPEEIIFAAKNQWRLMTEKQQQRLTEIIKQIYKLNLMDEIKEKSNQQLSSNKPSFFRKRKRAVETEQATTKVIIPPCQLRRKTSKTGHTH